ncbi:unnamed protein product [Dovyalis caffra]|uniref:Uncharacterized protein n=1 Tax=Dovyalis caffra TaxID=77055 RepID=A0AAV1SPD5_9ROSI|nr:unnamed protein product [Dovyalis caffra]
MDDSSWQVKRSSATLQQPLMASSSSSTPQEARNQHAWFGKWSRRFGDDTVECYSAEGECKNSVREKEERVFSERKFGCIIELCEPIVYVNVSGFCVYTQMEINSGQYFYPLVGHDLRSQGHGRMLDCMVSNVSNLSSHSGNVDLGNSFLALLSGPASFLPCDFQELPSSQQVGTSHRVPTEVNSTAFSAIGSRFPLTSGRIPSENLSYQNQRNGADPVVSSKAASACHSVLQHGPQAANFAIQSSDLAKAVIHHKISDIEKVKGSSNLRGVWRSTTPVNDVKLPDTNCKMPQKLPTEAEFSVSKNSSAFSRQHPRVFCLGKSGELLLSSTGLPGILCSCHCFHMSVSKFCEHSGLWNVNPGTAVHMDSGETIAQWRKLYFQKFGIRVPEDQSGWDWPEGLPLTASLVQSSIPLSLSKNSDCNHLGGSSGSLVRCGQPIDGVVFSKNPLTDKNSNVNSVIDALDKQKRNGQGGNKFLGLVGTLQSNVHGVGYNAPLSVTDSTISRCSTIPAFVGKGPENGCQSISAYIDNILKSGSFSTTNSVLQNARAPFRCSDVSRAKDEKDCVIIDKDTASSSIELRLGQPHQQSQSSGIPSLSSVRPQSCNILVNSQKPISREQMIHYVTSCGREEESRQCLPCVAGLSNSTREREQLNYGHCAIKNLMDVGKLEKFKGDVAKSTVFSPFKHFNSSLEGNSHSGSTNNVFNSTEQNMPETLCRETHAVKYAGDDPLNGGNGLERQRTDPEFGFSRPRDMGKGVGCLTGNSFYETNSVPKMHKWKKNPSSSGVINGNTCAGFPTMHEKDQLPHYLSSLPLDASDAGNLPTYLDKVPCFGSIDHVFPGALGSSMGSGQILPSQAVPIGFPSSASTSISGLNPALLKQDGIGLSPYLLHDNLRMLAYRQILELSKQQHEMSSLGKNHELDRRVKLQHSLFEPSASGLQRCDTNFNSKQDDFEVPMKSTQSTLTVKMGDDVAKCTHVTGKCMELWYTIHETCLNNRCNFSTLTAGMPFCSKEIDKQCQLPHSHLQNEQPLWRLGRNEHNISDSNEYESCCQMTQYFQTHCSCAAHTNCLGGKCTGGNNANFFREPMRGVGGKLPALMASQIVKDNIIPHENTISLDHCGKVKGHAPKNISCTSQWKDVPSKIKNVSQVARIDQSVGILDRRGHESTNLGDTAARCYGGAVHMADSFREQETSNISSGCSTPAVTQESTEVNNVDTSIVVAGNASCMKHLIVDEGSGIDKCCSSDDALESDRSANFCGSSCPTRLWKDRSSKVINNQSSRSLLDEVKLMDSLTWKRGRNQIQAEITVLEKTNHPPESDRGSKTVKRKREMKLDMLDASLGAAGHAVQDKYPECDETADQHCLSKDVHMVSSGQGMPCISRVSSIKPSSNERSMLLLSKPLSCKRDLQKLYNGRDGENDDRTEISNTVTSCKIEVSGRKKFRKRGTSDGCSQSQTLEQASAVGGKTMNCDSVSYMNGSLSQQVSDFYRKARPVVCGKYGEISNGEMFGDLPKPAKIVPLDRILRAAKKCTPPKNKKSRITSTKELKKTSFGGTNECFNRFSNMKKENEGNDASGFDEMNFHNSVRERENASVGGDKHFADELLVLGTKRGSKSEGACGILDDNAHSQSKLKVKEIRRRSLNELTSKDLYQILRWLYVRIDNPAEVLVSMYIGGILKCGPKMKDGKIIESSEDSKCHTRGSFKVNAKRNIQEQEHLSVMDSDSFCCVCGSSNKDEVNCLLECDQCLIKVHQACYGVSRVPKGHWYCRPCRAGAENTVCVLCGYGGGALTQALRGRAIVKSLLKAWSFGTECRPKNSDSSAITLQDEFSMLHSPGSALENNSYPVLRPKNIEPSSSSGWSINMQNQLDSLPNSLSCVSNPKVHNSITAGVLDSAVKQWVHMVCGLWTPGTRCPNVDTMSAFDVSGASYPGASTGLLQSEVEGVDNENVGFYGRCALHAMHATGEYSCDAANNEAGCIGEKEEICARTEGYKGRKRDGFWHGIHGQSKGNGGCLVPQEQFNAWMHINGQKSHTGLSKLPLSDVEHDCRKEYARYKQAKGWKYLVVYKSGIHALGLYTSRFIHRGEMVVEYVGEIVGQRVADRRENDYGRKLQYKSACYFFRIDKEHIIDATRKGGIARFVNHSCLPNCVAKVISVRNEKKVMQNAVLVSFSKIIIYLYLLGQPK